MLNDQVLFNGTPKNRHERLNGVAHAIYATFIVSTLLVAYSQNMLKIYIIKLYYLYYSTCVHSVDTSNYTNQNTEFCWHASAIYASSQLPNSELQKLKANKVSELTFQT